MDDMMFDFLLHAIINKKTEDAKQLIINGCKVNIENNEFSDTPLHLACMNGDVELAEMLLDKRADINATGKYGKTPLHIALDISKVKLIQLLLDRGASARATNDRGETPLHIAALRNRTGMFYLSSSGFRINIFMLLLSKGADVNAKTKDYLTPLIIAAKDGHQTNIKLLLKCGANVDDEDAGGNTVLELGVERGSAKIVRNILKFHPDLNNMNNRRSLYAAIFRSGKDHGKIIENLRDYGFPFDTDIIDNDWLLNAAIGNGYSKIVEDLKFSANLNILDDYSRLPLLHTASALGHDKVAKALLRDGADVNVKDNDARTPMFYAIQNEDLKIAELLLSSTGHVLNSDDDTFANYTSLLMLAARQGNDIITRMVLSKGINVDVKQNGHTALHIASRHGHENVTKILLQHWADPDVRDQDGCTPLRWACDKHNERIIEILFKYGADFNSRDENGGTVLHMVPYNFSTSIIHILLECGSDVNIICNNFTPFCEAIYTSISFFEEGGFEEIRKILEEHILKRAAANLYVTESDLAFTVHNDFYDKCVEEVEKMRQDKVCQNNNVSFYNILTKGINQWAPYARNKDISHVLGSRDYKEKFPIYASMIGSRFKRGRRRARLINSSTKFLSSLFPLPDHFMQEMFTYLSDKDLRNFIKSDPCANVFNMICN